VQDTAAPSNDTGACSSGSHPLVQNTYDSSTLGIAGSTDYPIGQLTRSVSTTYYPDSSSAVTTQQYQHDQRGRETNTSLQIALPSGWNVTTPLPLYQESLSYNDTNQAMTTQTTVGAQNGYTFSQVYDSSTGTLTGLSNNSVEAANLVSQSFDLHGMASSLTFQSLGGTPATIASESFGYDGDLRPASEAATWQSNGAAIFSTSRNYDPVGNVLNVSTTQAAVNGQSGSGGSEVQMFCYDEENRLVYASNTTNEASPDYGQCGDSPWNGINGADYTTNYVYTQLGQISQGQLSGKGAQQQYLYCDSSHPHELTGLYPLGTTCATKGSATASYSSSDDAWGNVTSRITGTTSAQLSYDVLNHFVQWSSTNTANQQQVNEQYVYDASGERVLRRSSTSTGGSAATTSMTVYAFGLEEHTYNGSGTSTGNTYYYTFAGRLIGQWNGTTSTQYNLTDAEGSVLASFSATTGTTSVLGNQLYDPYGNTRSKTGSLNTSKGYTGQYTDTATGLDYYNARYYDPAVARFLAADTVQGNAQGMDPYDYVGGNPETRTDPTGNRFVFADASDTVNISGIKGLTLGAGGTIVSTYNPERPYAPLAPTKILTPTYKPPRIIVQNDNPVQAIISGLVRMFTSPPTPTPSIVCVASFDPQTQVATSKGSSSIVQLHPKDLVWAYNPQTHKKELKPVLHLMVHYDTDLVDLTFAYTKSSHTGQSEQQVETIHTTQRHPFLSQEDGFVPAGQLVVGMHVVRSDGSVGTLVKWQVVPGAKDMYNLEVAQDHTFTVGDGQWVVHNCAFGPSPYNPQTGQNNPFTGSNGTPTDDEFDPSGLQGASLADIIAKLPPQAQAVGFKPSNDIEYGFKWKWIDSLGRSWEVEVHSPDMGPNAGVNASSGYIVRASVQGGNAAGFQGGRWYGDTNGNWYKANNSMPSSAANDSHIPAEDPWNPNFSDDQMLPGE
jgi:RHS repeat-associated protein